MPIKNINVKLFSKTDSRILWTWIFKNKTFISKLRKLKKRKSQKSFLILKEINLIMYCTASTEGI